MGVIDHPIVGRVSYGVGSGGKLILQDSWERANIATILIPQLKGVATYGGKFSGKVRFYSRAIPQLKAAFEAVEAAGLTDKIIFWDGSFVPRLKRGGSTPSNHSFGTAFDINADWNGFRQTPAAIGAKGDLHAVALIFKKFGFTWGGDWKNTPDGMHFEINRILSAQEIIAARGVVAAVETVKDDAALILATKDAKGELTYHRLDGAALDGGAFTVDSTDVLAALAGGARRVEIRAFLQSLGATVYDEGNYLSDSKEPRMYLFVDTK